MLDSEYFRKRLQDDVDALGGKAIVEVFLTNGRSFRVRSVVSIQQGYVTLEVYKLLTGEIASTGWFESNPAQPSDELERAVAPYEAIANVRITPTRSAGISAMGFG